MDGYLKLHKGMIKGFKSYFAQIEEPNLILTKKNKDEKKIKSSD